MINKTSICLKAAGRRLRAVFRPRAGYVFCAVFLAALLCGQTPRVFGVQFSEKELLAGLKAEENRANIRKDTLNRLTQDERKAYSSLASVEDNILRIEKNMAEQREKLVLLAKSGAEAQAEYEKISAERNKSEIAMREVLRTVWELHSRKQSIGGRTLDEWPVVDREYRWSTEIFASLDVYHGQILEREELLKEINGRRAGLARAITASLTEFENEKSVILADRIKYEQHLAEIRKNKQSVQEELDVTVKLISDLNFNLQSVRMASADIDHSKGSLVWPAQGRIVQRFKPPVQGIGIATVNGAPVCAVHAGTVMYNDTMRGLGRVVVVQHGGAYFTVYAFLSDSAVKQGQTVSRGQNIGKTGYYPVLKSSGVYFELRHHQKTVDPEPWLARMSG
ncbi:MAG: peptidoglycan DD-metalloendopeptidase family protein [Deltaproteobacteria bacterium]|nr:peptidoglycan DD-metalloendopeptidase family protein [Deltaproteobacteria bacterium]